jgi:hypothetical protein
MTTTFAVPTLGATTLLTEPGDIIAYQLRQFATTPQSISTLYYDQVISLIEIISRAGNDSQRVLGPAQEALTSVLNRIFGDNAAQVEVSAEQINDALYTLVLSVQVAVNNQVYGISSTVQINNGVLVLPNDMVPTLST